MTLFDESKFYLGSLCKRGHDYEGSGGSLRWNTSGSCVLCAAYTSQRWEKENPGKIRGYRKKWVEKNPAKCAETKKKWREDNREKERERAAACKRKATRNISDSYCKMIIRAKSGLAYEKVTPEMIELKRDIIASKRIITRLRGYVKDESNR